MLRSYLKIELLGRFALPALLALASPLLGAGTGASPVGREVVRARWLMGTVLEIRLPGATELADELAEAAFREVAAVEAAASLWRPGTELAAVHVRAAEDRPVVVSEILGALLEEALRAAALTAGAFSPAVGALAQEWDLRGEGRSPSPAEIARAAALARPDGVRFDPGTRTLRLEAGVTLDLDGIAKGFALDRAAAALRARGADDALLNFGGQLLAIGPPAGRPAREALVASPIDPSVPVFSVRLRDASLSTSANSERVRIVAGREAGHLLDPRTGGLVPLRGSATVLAPTGALADALSTAWAVEGPAGYRRTDPGSPFRRAGAVAFALPTRDGTCETVADDPFVRLGPPAGVADAAVPRP